MIDKKFFFFFFNPWCTCVFSLKKVHKETECILKKKFNESMITEFYFCCCSPHDSNLTFYFSPQGETGDKGDLGSIGPRVSKHVLISQIYSTMLDDNQHLDFKFPRPCSHCQYNNTLITTRGQQSVLREEMEMYLLCFSVFLYKQSVQCRGTSVQMCFWILQMRRAHPDRKETKEPQKSSTTTETFRRLYRSDKTALWYN